METMKSNLIKNLEKKYNVKVFQEYKNRYDEEFITCIDLDDDEKFTVKVLQGEFIEQTFKRVFGNR